MRRLTGRLLWVLAAFALFAGVGCASDADSGSASAASAATADGAIGWPGVHDAPPAEDPGEAPSGPDLGLLGQGSLEGQDVVIWFWAEW